MKNTTLANWEIDACIAKSQGWEIDIQTNRVLGSDETESVVWVRKHPVLEMERFNPSESVKDIYPFIVAFKISSNYYVPRATQDAHKAHWTAKCVRSTGRDKDWLRAVCLAYLQRCQDTNYKPKGSKHMLLGDNE